MFRVFVLGLALVAACASNDDEYDSESHFSCSEDADCSKVGAGFVCDAGTCTAVVARIRGAPIGDCTSPTVEALAAEGCPVEEPAPFAPCDTEGKVCRYAIRVQAQSASQVVFQCHSEGTWGSGTQEACGIECVGPGAYVLELSLGGCGSRPLSACESQKPPIYELPRSAYTLASNMLQEALEICEGDFSGNMVNLYLDNGCPERLTSTYDYKPSVWACLEQQLTGARWACAAPLPCVQRLWSLL